METYNSISREELLTDKRFLWQLSYTRAVLQLHKGFTSGYNVFQSKSQGLICDTQKSYVMLPIT